MTEKRKRNGLEIMAGLIGMIKPLLGIMVLAVLMGSIGNLVAIFITIFGGYGLLSILGTYSNMSFPFLFGMLILFAAARGIFRYAEQTCNHYIAFKLLARIRHQVFAALRKLTPAKLDGNEKGNLISILTSDIELLEVFYAHTISPIAIAILTSIVMCIYIGMQNVWLGMAAAIFYFLVGAVIPVWNGKRGREKGQIYRDSFGDLNTRVLDNLYGLEEILQYHAEEKRLSDMKDRTEKLEKINAELKKQENSQRIITETVILAASVISIILSGYFIKTGTMDINQAVISLIAIMSSFGPTAALSALSNNLNQTLASGERVLNLLEEEPVVTDIVNEKTECEGDIICEDLCFSYKNEKGRGEPVLKNFGQTFEENAIHGILGKSGCGKSTLLKLLMRFYETDRGQIKYGNTEVNQINTKELRNHISYVTQETFLFHDTIENNIKVAKQDALREEVIKAAKKASIHNFISALPNGYDTKLSELGDDVSGGERQRIGLARAFLHDSKVIFLDEPTSNIDSLNEGIILESLEKEKEDKTIILVSHRKSTMGIADKIVSM